MRFSDWLLLASEYSTEHYEADKTGDDLAYARDCFDAGWSVREFVHYLNMYEKIPLRSDAPPYDRKFDQHCWTVTTPTETNHASVHR